MPEVGIPSDGELQGAKSVLQWYKIKCTTPGQIPLLQDFEEAVDIGLEQSRLERRNKATDGWEGDEDAGRQL